MTTTEQKQKTNELLKDSLGVAKAIKWQLQRVSNLQDSIGAMEEMKEEYVTAALVEDVPTCFPVNKLDFIAFLQEQKMKACEKSRELTDKLNETVQQVVTLKADK